MFKFDNKQDIKKACWFQKNIYSKQTHTHTHKHTLSNIKNENKQSEETPRVKWKKMFIQSFINTRIINKNEKKKVFIIFFCWMLILVVAASSVLLK